MALGEDAPLLHQSAAQIGELALLGRLRRVARAELLEHAALVAELDAAPLALELALLDPRELAHPELIAVGQGIAMLVLVARDLGLEIEELAGQPLDLLAEELVGLGGAFRARGEVLLEHHGHELARDPRGELRIARAIGDGKGRDQRRSARRPVEGEAPEAGRLAHQVDLLGLGKARRAGEEPDLVDDAEQVLPGQQALLDELEALGDALPDGGLRQVLGDLLALDQDASGRFVDRRQDVSRARRQHRADEEHGQDRPETARQRLHIGQDVDALVLVHCLFRTESSPAQPRWPARRGVPSIVSNCPKMPRRLVLARISPSRSAPISRRLSAKP